MKKYEIVFIDIDGTLRDSNGNISNITKNQIKNIIESGIKVVLCTGRSRKYATNVAIEVGATDYLISSNGSEVTNIKTKEVIKNFAIRRDYVESIFSYCKSNNINMLLNTIEEDYQTIDESSNRKLINEISDVTTDVNQIVLTSKNYNRMLIIPKMFKDKYPNLMINGSSLELLNGVKNCNRDYYHDLNMCGVTKAAGIIALLEYLNIPAEKTITIGDSTNDISMCEVAGYCVAMGNAIDSLKKISDEIILSNDENGVAKFLSTLTS